MNQQLCGARVAKCKCAKPKGHNADGADPNHECESEICGGVWRFENGEFTVVVFPMAADPVSRALTLLIGEG